MSDPTIPLAIAAAIAAAALTLAHLVSLALAARACRATPLAPPGARPPVSVVRILCGVEQHTAQTLDSTFCYDYPDYEVLLCVASADDPVLPLARAAMARHPETKARLCIGDLRVGPNPKLGNMARGWAEAAHEYVVFLDSNLLTPPCYLARIAAAWRASGVGVVSSAPIGAQPQSAAAELEVAFLNTHAARWQLAAAALGRGFAQGKTLAFRRGALPLGDLAPLAAEPAEDAAATRLANACGRRVGLVTPPCAQPLGQRAFGAVWARQIRWARLRRASFPALYALEIAAGFAPAAALTIAAVSLLGGPVATPIALFGLWYGAEWALAWRCGWRAGPAAILAMALRDLALPLIWIAGWRGDAVAWRGVRIDLAAPRQRLSRPFAATSLAPRLRRLVRRRV